MKTKRYLTLFALGLVSGCALRAAAFIESGEATLQGTTSISRQQDKVPERQHSTLEGLINGTSPSMLSPLPLDNAVPEEVILPSIPKSIPTLSPSKPPLFTTDELNALLPPSK